MTIMPGVLAFSTYYLPGYRAGGPIRSLAYMADLLGDRLAFNIVTTDRDSGDDRKYPNIIVGDWNRVGNACVMYLGPNRRSFLDILSILRNNQHDTVYLNSFFDSIFTQKILLARALGLFPARRTVLAPRGELSDGALGIKSIKKSLYINASRALGLYRGLIWQASSEFEASDIKKLFEDASIVLAANLSPAQAGPTLPKDKEFRKTGAPLRICFLSRISPKKNLEYAIDILCRVSAKVEFNVYGPVSDLDYWKKCKSMITSLPSNIRFQYNGDLRPEEVGQALAAQDLFFFPTRGENYGHVIREALAAGLPVLISDQTPWVGLENKEAGWALPLQKPEGFVRVINEMYSWTEEKHRIASQNAFGVASDVSCDADAIENNLRLFGVGI